MLSNVFVQLKMDLEAQGYDEPIVPGDGKINAQVILLGEAPGKDEVAQGKPFVGKAGKNLDEFIERTGLARADLYITNVVKFRPYTIGPTGRKRNRPPTKREIALCSECLRCEVEIVQPKVIVTLGNTALQAAAANTHTIGAVHGQALAGKWQTPVFALYHPASVIYNQSLIDTYYSDLNELKNYLQQSI